MSASVSLLGPPRLLIDSGDGRPLERRQAALLGYLALQGPTSREKLAGLLWPDSGEEASRANLRQALRRLRQHAPSLLPEGADPIELAQDAAIDVRALFASGGGGAIEEIPTGELLGGFDYAELDSLSEWLYSARLKVKERQKKLLSARADSDEKDGDAAGAIAALRRALEVEPLSEVLQRRLMRALFLSGDRAAALSAFEHFRMGLEQDLGVRPSGETMALVDELSRAAPPKPKQAPARTITPQQIPLTVMRPPFVGREREWARMEAAWAANQNILLTGPSGVGKSRLMLEFVQSHSNPVVYRAMPTDNQVPYGTHARTFRQVVDQVGRDKLEPWVRDELSRIIPGLGHMPGPMKDEQDRLRFLLAKVEAFRPLMVAGHDALAFDDVHWCDDESAYAGAFVQQHFQGQVKSVHSGRSDLLKPTTRAVLDHSIAAGVLVEIELAPLDEASVSQLLAGTGVAGGAELAPEVFRLTGGNPLLALEALRARVTGQEAPKPTKAEDDAQLHPILASRFAALSPSALTLARTAAVLGKQFTLERARQVLDARPLDAVAWWAELQRAQVVRDSGLAHDMLRESLLRSLPRQVATVLHEQAARVLEGHGAPPAIVADHYALAGEPQRAAPFLLAAARNAKDALLLEKAAMFQALAEQAASAPPA